MRQRLLLFGSKTRVTKNKKTGVATALEYLSTSQKAAIDK